MKGKFSSELKPLCHQQLGNTMKQLEITTHYGAKWLTTDQIESGIWKTKHILTSFLKKNLVFSLPRIPIATNLLKLGPKVTNTDAKREFSKRHTHHSKFKHKKELKDGKALSRKEKRNSAKPTNTSANYTTSWRRGTLCVKSPTGSLIK